MFCNVTDKWNNTEYWNNVTGRFDFNFGFTYPLEFENVLPKTWIKGDVPMQGAAGVQVFAELGGQRRVQRPEVDDVLELCGRHAEASVDDLGHGGAAAAVGALHTC